MNIGIDARIIYRRGVGRYIGNLIEQLLKIDKKNKYFIYVNEASNDISGIKAANCVIRRLKAKNPFVFQQFALPAAAAADKIDILHGTDNVIPYFPCAYKGKKIVTIHDTMYVRPLKTAILKPTFKQRIIDIYNKYSIPASGGLADRIITVSQNSKRDIEKYIKPAGGKITVTYEAADKVYAKAAGKSVTAKVLKKFSISKPFILMSAAADTRKNSQRCLEAFAEFNARMKNKHQLVITSIGKKELGTTNILSKISLLGLDKCVIITGYTTDEEMAALYKSALFFLFPSLWEGFGLQVLEAFACGLPVITSQGSSLSEISADAAQFVEPESVQSIVKAMEKVQSSAGLRAKMKKKGKARAAGFDWKNTAQITLKAYKEVYNEK